ncbi:hypothetical protein [Chryseobacterium wanjuense]
MECKIFGYHYERREKIYQKVTKGLKKGSIILLHDTSEKTYNVLVDLLLFLKDKKYSTFTIDNILTTKEAKVL